MLKRYRQPRCVRAHRVATKKNEPKRDFASLWSVLIPPSPAVGPPTSPPVIRSRPGRASLVRCARCGAVCALTAIAWAADPPAPTTGDKLGFHFDQEAHDAALKKQATNGSVDSEPVPPGVVRLPRYVVRDKAVPLADHDVLTPKGRDEVAKKRYLSPLYQKTFGPLAAIAGLIMNPLGGWNPNSPEAGAFYEQDEDRRRSSEESDLRELAALADSVKDTGSAPAASSDQPKR